MYVKSDYSRRLKADRKPTNLLSTTSHLLRRGQHTLIGLRAQPFLWSQGRMKTTQWSPAWPPKGVPPYSISNVEIHKSPLDDRNYQYIRLEQNRLHVLLVQDSTTDKAAASMDVKVGHISDPVCPSSSNPFKHEF